MEKKEIKKKKKKPSKWCKRHHKVVRGILNLFFTPYVKRKYNIKIEKQKDSSKRQYLVLFNHQTAYDQFFVGIAFNCPVYYVASEDIFSMGRLSRLIEFLVKPIPIKKQTNDPRAVINCIKVAKEGGTIALAPEGNRTFDGRTCYIKPSIASLAKHLGLPIAFFKIEGGYGVHPRWSDVVRSGGMTAGVSRIIEPEEYAAMTDEELIKVINAELWQDEARFIKDYHHERLAEYLERAVYVCPDCGLSEFESEKDIISCKRCEKKIRYLPSKELQGIDTPFPFRYVADWYDYQCGYINSLDLLNMSDEPLYTDEISFGKVIVYKKKEPIYERAAVSLYKDKITVKSGENTLVFPFDELSAVTVLGKNKLNLYHGKEIYQLSGNLRLCALKYVNIYHRYKNIKGGDNNAEFLGL